MADLTCQQCKHLDNGECVVPLPWWLNVENERANVHWPSPCDRHAEECACFEEVPRG